MKITQVREIYILGCSGIAKSIIDTILKQKLYRNQSIYIVDPNFEKMTEYQYSGVKVIDEELISNGGEFICAFYKPHNIFSRNENIEEISRKHNLNAVTIIDDSSNISPTSRIGLGTYIAPGVVIDSDANVGNNSIILFNSVVSRECLLGDNVFISANVTIKGGVSVAKNNFISSNCVIAKNMGPYNFINSSTFITTSGYTRNVVGNKNIASIIDLPEQNEKAQKNLRFLNP